MPVAVAAHSKLARRVLYPGSLASIATRRAPVIRVGDVRGIDTYSSHPAVGLTADALLGMYREAERGVPVRQFDCFDDMIEVDGHLRGLLEERIEFVAGSDWTLKAGRPDTASQRAAEELEEFLRNHLGFREFVEHQLEAPHYGVAATNIVWDVVERTVAPTEFLKAAHRRLASPSAELAGKIMLVNGRTSRDLVELEPGLWAVSRARGRNPWSAGTLRTAAWWAMFKRWSVRDWQVFAEMFGLPLAIGYYQEGASLESRQALDDVVRSIGTDGYAVLADTTEVVVKDTARAGDSSTVYPKIAALCEAQMSKLLAGSTTAADTGGEVGSYALGSVHEARSYALKRADARRVEEMFVRDIGRWFCAWNGYDRAAAPRLKIQITRDSLERAQVLEKIGQVVELDQDQIREEFSLRTPAPGTGVKFEIKPAATPGNAPASPAKKG